MIIAFASMAKRHLIVVLPIFKVFYGKYIFFPGLIGTGNRRPINIKPLGHPYLFLT